MTDNVKSMRIMLTESMQCSSNKSKYHNPDNKMSNINYVAAITVPQKYLKR